MKDICIIGAGASGMGAAKSLLARGLGSRWTTATQRGRCNATWPRDEP